MHTKVDVCVGLSLLRFQTWLVVSLALSGHLNDQAEHKYSIPPTGLIETILREALW